MKLAIALISSIFVASASGAISFARYENQASDSLHKNEFSLSQARAGEYLLDASKTDKDFANILKEALGSEFELTSSSGEAQRWFDQQIKERKNSRSDGKGKPMGISFHLKSMANMDNDLKRSCSLSTMFMIFHFMHLAKTSFSDPKAAQYARHIGSDKLKMCASKFNDELSRSRKSSFEATMDKLFGSVSGRNDEWSLLVEAEKFDFDRMANQETVCRVARTFNRLRKAGQEADKFKSYMSKTYAIDCEHQVPQFFERTCNLDRNDDPKKERESGLRIVNAAVALGVKPGDIVGGRTLKLNEYKRICRNYPKFEKAIEDEMKKVSQDKEEPEIVERPNRHDDDDDDDLDSPGDSAYFEALRSSATEGAQRHAMLLDEDAKSSGGLKFWRKWTN